MRYHQILCESTPRTLYHGTLRSAVPAIMKMGLMPDIGEFTRNAYQEYEDAGIELPELVFAAGREDLRKCVSAIIGAMRNEEIKVTPENFREHGAIIVLKHAEEQFQRRGRDDDEFDSETYPTVEPGDYFTDYGVEPSFALTGNKMVSFLRRNGVNLNRSLYKLDTGGERAALVRDILKVLPPNVTPDEARAKMRDASLRQLEATLQALRVEASR